jgi:hypothetical protein
LFLLSMSTNMALMDASHLTSEPAVKSQSGRFTMASQSEGWRSIPRIALTMVKVWGCPGCSLIK